VVIGAKPVMPFTHHRRHRSLRKRVALIVSVSLAFAILVSFSPCCQLFDGLLVPTAHAASSSAATPHDHHGHPQPNAPEGAPTSHGPCNAQEDLSIIIPALALGGTTPQFDDTDFVTVTASPEYSKDPTAQPFRTHGPPPLARPLYLRFARLIE